MVSISNHSTSLKPHNVEKHLFSSLPVYDGKQLPDDEVMPSLPIKQQPTSVDERVFFPCLKDTRIRSQDDPTIRRKMQKMKSTKPLSVPANTGLDSYSISGFLHQERQVRKEKVRKDFNLFLRVPESRLLPTAKDLQAHNDKQHRKLQEIKMSMVCTKEEQCSQNVIIGEYHVHEQRATVKPTSWDGENCSSTRNHKRSSMLRPYQKVNSTITKVLGKKPPSQYKEKMRSKGLDSQILLYRSEIEAAIILQIFWRRHLAKKCIFELKLQRLSAIKIQSKIREMLIRRWFCRWKKKLEQYSVICQARVRSRIIRRMWHIQQKMEGNSARTLQCAIRCFLAAQNVNELRFGRSATVIETMYRGWKCRKVVSLMRKNKSATIICGFARRILSKRLKIHIHEEKSTAVTIISRCWRSHCAKSVMTDLLYQRNIEKRQKNILMLVSEANDLSVKIDRTQQNHEAFLRKGRYNRIDEQVSEFSLQECEKNFNELLRLQLQVTPQSVQGGWLEQTKRSVKEKRKEITTTKLDIIFNQRRKNRLAESALKQMEEKIRTLTLKKQVTKKWVDDFAKDLWNYKQKYDYSLRRKHEKQMISKERNKWRLQPTTFSGKPDKSIMRKRRK